ncbi:MAG: DUF4105 domain-containing protein [Burkholderiales bacterium]|nr:DUF4105 domain-containing protein [Burkholderiales bacterium]
MLRLIGFLLLQTIALVLIPVHAADYADELVTRARALRLDAAPEWHRLLHYKPRTWGGVKSEADDPAFFNSPRGKTDAAAELEATLRSFFSDEAETDQTQNPQCRFIARHRWLKSRLDFDPKRLPARDCARYRAWRDRLAPSNVALVFPTGYLNSPGTMYGHTLLRIDGRDQSDRTRLLAYAINFAAATDETNGLTFAVRGLLGGYPGRYSMMPYYVKVAEYTDLESRDIWEYDLDLNADEIERLMEHVWELGPIRFDYYFLDENCSYQLLGLLDVARPGLDLSAKFPLWAIPADTVRVVTETPGLVRRVVYRPARATTLSYRAKQLTTERAKLVRAVADGRVAPTAPAITALSDKDRAETLELAFDDLDYRRLSGKAKGDRIPARLRELLIERSRLPAAASPEPPVPTVRPDQGHRSGRVAVGAGSIDGRGFQELRFRGAYHDLLDPQPGYLKGAQIEFANTVLRRENDDRIRLERLSFVNVTSIAARDALVRPLSWRVDFGVERTRAADHSRPMLFQATGGGGFATEFGDGGLAYVMLEAGLIGSGRFDPGLGLGVGGSAGMVFDVSPRWRVQAWARSLHYAIEGPNERQSVGLAQQITLTKDLGLRVELDGRREFGVRWSTVGAYLNWYF